MKRTVTRKEPKEKSAHAAPASRRRRPQWSVAGSHAAIAGQDAPYFLRTISRALDILEAFDERRVQLTLQDLSRIVGVPASSLFRMLVTLQSRNYLQQNDDGSYQLTAKVLHGRLYEQAEQFRRSVRPELQSLAGQFNENVSLAYLFGEHIQVIDSVDSLHEIRITNRRGRVLPPHCSAMGKAITAFQPREDIDRILEAYGLNSRTPHSICDRRTLIAHFEHIRQSGIAYDREESTLGGICVASAIETGANRVMAAISVSTPLARMTAEREKEIVASVGQTAHRIAADLQKDLNAVV
ncbi:MAG TPA: IclR family transcriptional regulator [Acidobacteriaceae bacterium]|jgi:DNA-binding IclR family transcriptional regulator|nr:IclR family transcriptional regulator [Acidobacteriaceae bacterium]